MRVEYLIWPADLGPVPELARRVEDLGYDQLCTAEIGHDPFFPLLLAAGRVFLKVPGQGRQDGRAAGKGDRDRGPEGDRARGAGRE